MTNKFGRYVLEVVGVDVTDKATFSRFVRDGRALAGMSLRDAANEFRTAPGTVSRWENGFCAPPVVARREILRLFSTRIRKIAAQMAENQEESAPTEESEMGVAVADAGTAFGPAAAAYSHKS